MDERTKQVEEIEATQKALRVSIDAAKHLAEKADVLLNKHKKSLKKDRSPDDS